MAMEAGTGAIGSDKTLLNKAMESAVKMLIYERAQDVGPKKK